MRYIGKSLPKPLKVTILVVENSGFCGNYHKFFLYIFQVDFWGLGGHKHLFLQLALV